MRQETENHTLELLRRLRTEQQEIRQDGVDL